MGFDKEFPDLQNNALVPAPSKSDEVGFACSSHSWWITFEALLPGSSCAYSHLVPHLIYFLSDSLDSAPLHEVAHLSGKISLSVLVAKLVFSQMLFFLDLLLKIIFRQFTVNTLPYIII